MSDSGRALRRVVVALAIVFAALPASAAFARSPCAEIRGQGDEQPSFTWISDFTASGGAWEHYCSEDPEVIYTHTNDGETLEEFALQEHDGKFELTPSLGVEERFSGFIGTDEPPTTTQLKYAKEASGSVAEVVPVAAAPIAVILHAPSGITLEGAQFSIAPKLLAEVFSGNVKTWAELLDAAEVSFKETGGAGATKIKVEVPADDTGVTYAFKNYLCQIQPATWGGGAGSKCNAGEGYVDSAANWPASTEARTEYEEKSTKSHDRSVAGDARAVAEEEGAIGYSVVAGATAVDFTSYTSGASTFWAEIDEAEPVTREEAGNCPWGYSGSLPTSSESEGPNWSNVHLANPAQKGGIYSICTLVYDIAWNKYNTAKLEAEYGSKTDAEQIGNSAKAFLRYLAEQGQKEITEHYSKLPTEVDDIHGRAEEIAAKVG